MLLEITKTAEVGADTTAAWALIRDVPRLSGCVPNVSDLKTVEEGRRYTAIVADKLGPFKVQVPVQIELTSVDEPRQIVASLSGNDGRGQVRVRGTLEATVDPAGDGSRLTLGMRLEVLGKLATLGAAPMRRRADDIFGELSRCVQRELAGTLSDEPTGAAGRGG